jgi:hypothetical protein
MVPTQIAEEPAQIAEEAGARHPSSRERGSIGPWRLLACSLELKFMTCLSSLLSHPLVQCYDVLWLLRFSQELHLDSRSLSTDSLEV